MVRLISTPFSSQSGISSSKAEDSIQAPERVFPPGEKFCYFN